MEYACNNAPCNWITIRDVMVRSIGCSQNVNTKYTITSQFEILFRACTIPHFRLHAPYLSSCNNLQLLRE